MKRTFTTLLLSLFGASVLVLSGCSWTQRGAAAGGALGSAVGGVWGYSAATYLTTAQCALIGGAAGAVGGAVIGNQTDQRRGPR